MLSKYAGREKVQKKKARQLWWRAVLPTLRGHPPGPHWFHLIQHGRWPMPLCNAEAVQLFDWSSCVRQIFGGFPAALHLIEPAGGLVNIEPGRRCERSMASIGVEPIRPFGHRILSPARLPIPPRGRLAILGRKMAVLMAEFKRRFCALGTG